MSDKLIHIRKTWTQVERIHHEFGPVAPDQGGDCGRAA
jgi:hypothetical protein